MNSLGSWIVVHQASGVSLIAWERTEAKVHIVCVWIDSKLSGEHTFSSGAVDWVCVHIDKLIVVAVFHSLVSSWNVVFAEANTRSVAIGHPNIELAQFFIEGEGTRLGGFEHDWVRNLHACASLADVAGLEAVDTVTRVVLSPPEHTALVDVKTSVDSTVSDTLTVVSELVVHYEVAGSA